MPACFTSFRNRSGFSVFRLSPSFLRSGGKPPPLREQPLRAAPTIPHAVIYKNLKIIIINLTYLILAGKINAPASTKKSDSSRSLGSCRARNRWQRLVNFASFIYKVVVKIKKLYFFTTVFWVIISCK